MLIGASVPLFVLGLLLAYVFGTRLGWLPPSGRITAGPGASPVSGLLCSLLLGNWLALADRLQHLILPAVTLSAAPLTVVVRMTRACLRQALGEDHVRTARAKGLPERAVLLGHALRSAWLPILTVIGLQAGLLFSGAILTEAVFSWPGLGQLVVDRILARDYPVVQGVVLVTALIVVLVNLLADVCYTCLDPRIRYG
jgi:ABC-type dipeptide/oligopeptide/nickel transport system permease component